MEDAVNILVATDFSENSMAAVRWGAFLANQLGSDMTLMNAVDLASGDSAWRVLVETPEEIERQAVDESRQRLETFLDEAVDERPEKTRFVSVLGSPTEQILSEAESLEDPILVVGTRGASRLKEFLLGNTARRLVRASLFPVILVPPNAEVSRPRELVVGVDFSEASREAIRRAALMARTYDASVRVVYGYVLPEVATFDGSMASVASEQVDLVSEREEALSNMVEEVGASDVVNVVEALQLPPAQAITTVAERANAQFVFVGTHGRRGLSRFFLGNTAERVMRKSPCAIFVVPVESREND